MVSRKRAFDIVISAAALAIAVPLLLLIALVIIVEDGFPVIFKQQRIGKNGQLFWVYKFRKLKHRPAEGTPLVVTRDDERYTVAGRLLDATKLNELPQLLNILKGDMSLVGPRPEIPEFMHCYRGVYRNLLLYRPGIFGPSQTAFRNELAMYPAGVDKSRFYENNLFNRKAEIDMQYYPNATAKSDAYWILRSLRAVLLGPSRNKPALQIE